MASTILNANSVNNGATVTIYTTGSNYQTGSLTVPSSYTINNGGTYSTSAWSSITSTGAQSQLQVTGDADIAGNLKVGGKDIAKSLENIEKRLAILVPDSSKLEKFEALKKAYDHYKLLEALCHEEKKDD